MLKHPFLVAVLLSAVAGVYDSRAADTAPAIFAGESPFKAMLARWAVDSGVARETDLALGPYADLAKRVAESVYEGFMPAARTSSLHWPLLVLMVLIAIALFVVRGGRGARDETGEERPASLAQYLLPRRLYAHPSARVDIWLYLLDRALTPVWIVFGLGLIAPFVERHTMMVARYLFGPDPAMPATLAWRLAYGLVTLLVADMIFYFIHLFGHRTRIGWAFHKVHHSAEVLTPLTRYREHFVEGIYYAAGRAAGLGFCGGVFGYLLQGPLTEVTVMNLGIFVFLFTLNANFRHYHVSLRYPPWLERWLQSPGLHHFHHSCATAHWDKNLGLVTSIWDRLVGTLYIGARHEATPWGLPPDEQARYRTFSQNVFGPFREIYQLYLPTKAVTGLKAG